MVVLGPYASTCEKSPGGLSHLKVILACAALISTAHAEPNKHELLLQTFSMSVQDAAKLEDQARAGNDELIARYKLLHYYSRNQKYAEAGPHYLWLVENHPASSLLDWIMLDIEELPSANRERAIELWEKHIANESANVNIMENAAWAFQSINPPRAIELLEKAAKLDPKNPEWHQQLGRLYFCEAREGDSINATEAKRSFAAYEQALALSKPADRFNILENAANAALVAGELDKARQHANELLDRAVEAPPGWNYGNAVHHGNLILGHLALRDGRIEEAEEFLLRAGKTPGSPQLNSFGPNMRLALELLQKGRRDRVVEYFRLCQGFWNRPELGAWIKTVESGGIPDFGANLDY